VLSSAKQPSTANVPIIMATAPQETIDVESDVRTHRAWNVVVWDDPVNLMSYVVFVFRKLFGYSEAEATKLMLEVHHDGKSIVASAPRERAEMDCYRLHRYGLWATIERP
jgi:ATP-dependent Clp protease adaptor protein ClpS